MKANDFGTIADAGTGTEKNALAEASERLRTQVWQAAGRDGFVTCRRTGEATRGAWDILEAARRAHAHNRPVFALDLILRVLHAMVSLIGKCDDSDGNVGDAIRACLELIRETVSESADAKILDRPTRKALFNKLITEASNRRYEGWIEWPLHLLETCSWLTDDPVFYDRLESHLSAMMAATPRNAWSGRFEREQVAQIQHRMIRQRHGEAAARAFIEAHLDLPSFREMAIETALAEQNFAAALTLAQDGETADHEYAGLVTKWKGWQHAVYQRSGQIDRQREMALALLLGGDFEYYGALKRTYRPDEWAAIYPGILQRLAGNRSWGANIYASALIEEQEWGKLLQYVQIFPSTIEHYGKYLLPDYRDSVFAVYVRLIEETAAEASNRKQYQKVCAIIRKLQNLGGRDAANQAIQTLRSAYVNRPALLDELAKI